jgi:polyhydroxybutyrate depolymerase
MNLRSSAKVLISLSGPPLVFGCSDATSMTGSTATVGGSGGGSTAVAGTSTTGTGGMSGTASSGTAAVAGGTGTAGVAGVGGSGAVAGATGTGGSAGMPPVGMYNVPRGKSAGCGKNPPAQDSLQNYVKHDIAVTGVDPQFIADHPSNPGNNGGYTYAMRNYFLKLPAGYDPTKLYALTFGGGGCGNTGGDSGRGGGQQASGIPAIQVGLSYVYSGGACFEDGYTNTPEVPYFDAVMAEISANYCVNLEKVFVGGYSSGAWESITLGLGRGGVIRGIATGAGGLRMNRPKPSGIPMAAILLTGASDTTNPADGPTGSSLARDLIMMTNKCVGTDTMPFAGDPDCVQYTGCPAAFPVVWCRPAGGHTGGSGQHWAAVSAFWDGLPAVP